MKTLKIHTEFINLGDALKLLNIIQTGGEAKYFLKENSVFLNGLKEDRRGKKLYPKDCLRVLDEEYTIENAC